MEFEEYLKNKKIDPKKFRNGQPEQFDEWNSIFQKVHPESFTQQKLFLINNLRRMYIFEELIEDKKVTTARSLKPKIPLKPKKS